MKKIIAFLSLVMCAMFITGCSPRLVAPTGEVNMIKASEVLVYEDYIYYGGKYTSNSSMVDGDNKNADLDAMYRVKLVDGEIEYDEDGNVKNVEKVVSKVVGTENAFVRAYGDLIVFGSPNTHKTEQSKTAFDRTTYFKMNSNGKGLKELYTTNSAVKQQSLFAIDDNLYIVCYDGENIVKIDVNAGTHKILAENVTSVAFASEYKTEFDKDVYFTVEREQESELYAEVTGTILNKVNVVSEESSELRKIAFETLSLKAQKDGYIFYTRSADEGTFYYANNFETGTFEGNEVKLTADVLSDTNITNFTPLGVDEEGEMLPIVFTYASKLAFSEFGSLAVQELLASSPTILFADGEYVYYLTSDGLYRVSYKDKQPQLISEKTDIKTNVSFDGKYVYFYAKNEDNTTGNYYMYRADVTYAENNNGVKEELLSKLHEDDIKESEEK